MEDFKPSYIKKCSKIEEFNFQPIPLGELFQKYKTTVPKNSTKTDFKMLSSLRIAMSNACCDKYLQQQSIHDMFLIGYMKEKYGKDWYEDRASWL